MIGFPSKVVTTFEGAFLFRVDTLLLRVCELAAGSESVCVMGAIWSVLSLRITSSLACFSTGRFLKLNVPKSSSAGVPASRPPLPLLLPPGTGTASVCRTSRPPV